MKWRESDFNSGLQNVNAVLVYGPDAGKVDIFTTNTIKKLNIDRDNVFVVSSANLEEKSEMIFAEACSISMFGGNKLIMITDAGDSDAKLVGELVAHPSRGAFVIVSGGELRAGGGLRTLFEDEKNTKIAALACYTDDARALGDLIRENLFAAGMQKVEPDAMNYMLAHLGADRGITISFLNKIAIYCDDTRIVSLDDVVKCLPDTGAADIDDFMYSLTAGQPTQTMRALDRLFFDNTEPNMLVRMLNSHFKKLLDAVATGTMPKLFYKTRDQFATAMKIWPMDEISGVLTRLNELEKQFRTTKMPTEVLMRDFALKLSVRALKLSVKKR
ncbi:MAG: DNA polymerase III subunit delta [Rickettsiales bacterium]|jgi:DNA polymerase-3 subunit delta|nr:DNA polymerase III subunit delta [Rickettsiales bacterium]